MAEKVEQPSEQQPPAEAARPEKKAKPPKAPKQPKKADGRPLPALVELTFTVSVALLVLVFLAMFLISWLTDATLRDFVLRTSVALLVLGSLLLVVFRQVSTGVVKAGQAELDEAQKQAAETAEKDAQAVPAEAVEPAQPPEKHEQPADPDIINLRGLPEVQ
jgi:hypothetical protein